MATAATVAKKRSGASPKTPPTNETTSTTTTAAATTPAVDNQYFFEDEIFRIDKKGRVKFGLIIETSETYSDEDDEFDDVLCKGEVRVAWYPEGKEDVQSERAIGLVDRTLMPGDVVRRLLPGKDTQRGYCREIGMCADVKVLGTKYVIKNVMAERLRLIANWQRDSAVCLDSWVGSTKDFEEKAVLSTAYGARIEISSSNFYDFTELNSRNANSIFNPQSFYAGNVVVGRLPTMDNVKLLTPKVPLHVNKKGKPMTEKFTIESVYTDSVWVHWQCKALSDESNIQSNVLQQPNPCVTGDDLKRLKRLNLFESCMLQINDRNYLKFSQFDTAMRKSDWDKEQVAKFKTIFQQQQKEVDRNLLVHTGSGSPNNSHHFEKLRKKLSLHDGDKTGKLKKFGLKADKLSISLSKDKAHYESGSDGTNTAGAAAKKSNSKDDTGWISDDDDDDDDVFMNFNEDAISSTTTMSTCSSPSPSCSPKHLNRRQLKKKTTKTLKKPLSITPKPEFQPKDGDELVTEALLVYSRATVVWQDGTIEHDIPSTQLYPIHHLDNHEFFPGDFVISGKEDADVSYRDYGVIQTVDHQGRIARVKWFTTYTSADEPKPSYKGESEVSVYDLKDHPDFQYRPGTMVIRVANFVGDDATCTAGQIIDNFIDGRVKVWWVDGHISMCWPQDLFEVGQYDHADWGHESEDSWETESENSEFGGSSSPKLSIAESHILSNIERTRVAIARLEEIFNISPNLQNPDVMRKLLSIYKDCRYLDRLLNTSFFHEDHFQGLLERVRKGGAQTISERALDHKHRLFSEAQSTVPQTKQQQHQQQQSQENKSQSQQQQFQHTSHFNHYHAIVAVNSSQQITLSNHNSNPNPAKEYAPKVLFNISSTPFKCTSSSTSLGNASVSGGAVKRKCSPIAVARCGTDTLAKSNEAPTSLYNLLTTKSAPDTSVNACSNASQVLQTLPEDSPNKNNPYNAEKNELLNSVLINIERAVEKTNQLKGNITVASSQDDSGNFSRTENCDGSSTSYTSSSDLTNNDTNSSLTKANDDPKSISCSSIELTEDACPELVCVRLCTLLKDQLVKSINEIREKYYKEDNLNLCDLLGEETSETIVETKPSSDIVKSAEPALSSLTTAPATAKDDIDTVSTPTQPVPSLASIPSLAVPSEFFQVLQNAPKTHKFHLTIFHPNNTQQYYKAVQREHRMLKNSLPPGVWVRVFEDRMDLLSVMIEGPNKTPYEDGMFFFDIQLGREYPKNPPLCYYISYCSDRLNPNLYEDGKVCVSLLGTWSGRDSEVWGPNSTLLQVIVSIQGLILVPEPYFNEAGYEKQKDSQQGKENSRMYNEMVIIKMVQATTKLLQHPPEIFRNEIMEHFKLNGLSMYERIRGWMLLSQQMLANNDVKSKTNVADAAMLKHAQPDFSLVPASRGFCLTLDGLLETFKTKLHTLGNASFTDITKMEEDSN